MNTQEEWDKNLLVVAAVEGYAHRHNIAAAETLELFTKNRITDLIRSNYDTLHTQELEESLGFAEDVLERKLR
ncbi:hypothetical protein AGMMS49944_26570 [Spirochaetia bacterium]|nr:hypothetical protein AGMMS49944_26570 [Spirochaetia bacterium]